MKRFANRHFVREVVILDDSEFKRCTFVECRFSFRGGECSMEDCVFVKPRFEFSGAAANTVSLLHAIGGLNPKMFAMLDG